MKWQCLNAAMVFLAFFTAAGAFGADSVPWPPALKGANSGTATLRSEMFLQVP